MTLTRLEKLRLEADKAGATVIYFDAVNAILKCPDLKDQILDDLEWAIETHKERKD